ncbi:LysR family transcriptional regulator [Paenibacillus xerothermodurans]|uniref:LysR family transcriptional regulator n=1 Tax=Paenibacillus xerothermodurans TaxID=1977292 RepID=A0A2W1NCE4_PAEXE|nr:LysR family transcriptional regulator [Paenibacillus xerothermodurans]PZE21330.1 LysR family transcriptional regulator [Paenibacillus xerothermodurans]
MLENIDIFAVVVEMESLNKASHSLNISQPALSRKIMRLEQELGVELFRRKGKRLELTQAGQICYSYALEQRHLERKLQRELEQFKTTEKPSSIIIGASLTTLQSTLPDLITIYAKDYPNTDIKAVTGKTHEIVPMVKERKVDIGLVASKIEHPGLQCIPLFDDHLCVVLPSGHPFVDKASIEISDLHELPMILFSRGTWYRVLMDELFHRYAIQPDVRMEIDSFEAIIRLVSTCQTATLLPESYLRRHYIEENELHVRFIPALEQTTRTTSLLFTEEAVHHPSAQQFIEKARNYFTGKTGQ